MFERCLLRIYEKKRERKKREKIEFCSAKVVTHKTLMRRQCSVCVALPCSVLIVNPASNSASSETAQQSHQTHCSDWHHRLSLSLVPQCHCHVCRRGCGALGHCQLWYSRGSLGAFGVRVTGRPAENNAAAFSVSCMASRITGTANHA